MRRIVVVTVTLAAVVASLQPARADDPQPGTQEWRERDARNMEYATQRQQDQLAHPAYGNKYWSNAIPLWISGWFDQAQHPNGLSMGLSRLVPGQEADPYRHEDWNGRRGIMVPVEWPSRCGARIQGTLFAPRSDARDPVTAEAFDYPLPGVVVTTGSIQGYQEMYWWAAQGLAEAGYVVLTYDVMGQGRSEWTCPGGGSSTGFANGTLDALNFLLGGDNPMRAWVDETRIGLAGHSAGASAVTQVGNREQIEIRPGVSVENPTRAVVGWDAASLGSVAPRVPTMSQNAEYFFNPTPTSSQPSESRRGWYTAFETAGLEAMQVSLRGSTHLEWTWVPYILPASRKGERVAMYYTLAWFDRWLKGPVDGRQADDALRRLTATVFDASSDASSIGTGTWDMATNSNVPHRIAGELVADHMSIYYKSSYTLPSAGRGCADMRKGC